MQQTVVTADSKSRVDSDQKSIHVSVTWLLPKGKNSGQNKEEA
jgi:hypothetical protein